MTFEEFTKSRRHMTHAEYEAEFKTDLPIEEGTALLVYTGGFYIERLANGSLHLTLETDETRSTSLNILEWLLWDYAGESIK